MLITDARTHPAKATQWQQQLEMDLMMPPEPEMPFVLVPKLSEKLVYDACFECLSYDISMTNILVSLDPITGGIDDYNVDESRSINGEVACHECGEFVQCTQVELRGWSELARRYLNVYPEGPLTHLLSTAFLAHLFETDEYADRSSPACCVLFDDYHSVVLDATRALRRTDEDLFGTVMREAGTGALIHSTFVCRIASPLPHRRVFKPFIIGGPTPYYQQAQDSAKETTHE